MGEESAGGMMGRGMMRGGMMGHSMMGPPPNHADALIGPPAMSNATPVPQAPSADIAKPIVEWRAIVAPLFSGIALWLMPAVKEPLSPGTVNP